MADKLTIRLNERKLDELLVKRDVLTIGRKPDNDIRLDDITVSNRHAKLYRKENRCYLEDEDSTNGTYVNGVAVRSRALVHGDRIVIGKYSIQYEEIEPEPLSLELDPTLQLDQRELTSVISRFEHTRDSGSQSSSQRTLKWIAQDENGVWWGFENKPVAAIHGWIDEDEGLKVLLKQEQQANSAWKDTLRKL